MKKFKDIKELQSKVRSGEVSIGDLDYMVVGNIEYKMNQYDEQGKAIIWLLDHSDLNVYGIDMVTENRYESVDDATFDEYYY